MGLFKSSTVDQINAIAAKSKDLVPQTKPVSTSVTDTLNEISQKVVEYFKDSHARPITTVRELHEYIDHCIKVGYAGIDTETTGLDRIRDYVVGWSIYAPGKDEIYIPCKHRMPIFETPYPNQLTYEQCKPELQRLVDAKVRMVFANADFDIAMIYKDLGVDFCDTCYYDVILAWRCLKENEKDNSLKGLYAKYPKKGKVDPMKFSDFFPPSLFPYCKPEIAALYAANDAKITYELFVWQLPYVTKGSELCTKHHLEKIADLVWNIEFPMIKVCAMLHRRGVFLDDTVVAPLHVRYQQKLDEDRAELSRMVQQLIDEKDAPVNRKRPFRSGADFNPNSNVHVPYLIKTLLGHADITSTGKEVLNELNEPVAKQILKVRNDVKLLGTYVDKMPGITGPDNRVHCSFKSIGAATGRMCLAKGTMVSILDGHKPIEYIEPGDMVYCLDENDMPVVRKVLNKWRTGRNQKCVLVNFKDTRYKTSRHLICTPEHRIMLNSGEWIEAINLQPGQELKVLNTFVPTIKHVSATVLSVVMMPDFKLYDVYDIEVDDPGHHFAANGIIVHNSSESPNMQNIPSKLHDIRHMFRATPEQTELMEVDDDNMIVLSDIDRIEVKDKGLTYVKDLVIGDIVTMSDGQETCEFKISGLEVLEDSACCKIELEQIFN